MNSVHARYQLYSWIRLHGLSCWVMHAALYTTGPCNQLKWLFAHIMQINWHHTFLKYQEINIYMALYLYNSDAPGAPQNMQVSNTTSSAITLAWSPPLVSETLGLTIFSYTINCSTDPNLQSSTVRESRITDAHYTTLSNLHPFTIYNCCVAVNSNHGRGKLACLSTVTGGWHSMISTVNLQWMLNHCSSQRCTNKTPEQFNKLNKFTALLACSWRWVHEQDLTGISHPDYWQQHRCSDQLQNWWHTLASWQPTTWSSVYLQSSCIHKWNGAIFTANHCDITFPTR